MNWVYQYEKIFTLQKSSQNSRFERWEIEWWQRGNCGFFPGFLEGRSDSTGDYFDRSVSLDLQVGVPSLNPKTLVN